MMPHNRYLIPVTLRATPSPGLQEREISCSQEGRGATLCPPSITATLANHAHRHARALGSEWVFSQGVMPPPDAV